MVSLGFLDFTFIDLLDILTVGALIYMVFRWIKGSSAVNIFTAIILVLVVRVISEALEMKMLSSVLGTIIDMGAVALIIIFQPEIRRFLNNLGRSAGSTIESHGLMHRLLRIRSAEEVSAKATSEIAEACMEMGEQKTGALIIIRRQNALDDIIATGDTIDAEIVCRLIMNIFFKNSPLHDGAMVIGGDRIIAARCTLPITDRTDLPASYGMRHKAAVGISEQSDADVVVVSEETGHVSFVHDGNVRRVKSASELKLLIAGKTENDGHQA